MKDLKLSTGHIVALGAILGASLLFTGCESQPVFADFPPVAGTAAVSNGGTASPNIYKPLPGRTDVFQVGDSVNITFTSANVESPLQPYQEAIKDDGKITPPVVGSIVALGKSPGQVQSELQEKYNIYFRNMTVTVTSKDRYYYVSGEVKAPGPKPYLGETDIIKAISSAGDFTDFANRRKVRLFRSGKKEPEIIDVIKAIEDPDKDVRVFPNDKIVIPRRLF